MRSIRNAKEVSIARNDKGNELTRRTDAEGNLKVLDCGTLDIGGEVAGRDGRAMAGEEKVTFLDFASSMLHWLPEKRKTASELLQHPFFDELNESRARHQMEV